MKYIEKIDMIVKDSNWGLEGDSLLSCPLLHKHYI